MISVEAFPMPNFERYSRKGLQFTKPQNKTKIYIFLWLFSQGFREVLWVEGEKQGVPDSLYLLFYVVLVELAYGVVKLLTLGSLSHSLYSQIQIVLALRTVTCNN